MSMSPEPMSLGSPTQSPTQTSQTAAAGPYHHLPQFLLGDMNSSSANSPMYHHSSQYRHPTPQPQQAPPFFGAGGSGGSGGSSSSSQRYWPSSSNSPPRTNVGTPGSGGSGSGSGGAIMSLQPHHGHFMPQVQHLHPHHQHHLGRTYSTNTYDYCGVSGGHMRGIGDKNENAANMSGYGGNLNSYSPSTLASQQQQQQLQLQQQSTSINQAPGAPPLNRLVDMMNNQKSSITPIHHQHHHQPETSASILSPYTPPNAALMGGGDLFETSQHQQISSTSPLPPSSSSSSGGVIDDTWVTIFGHPPSATSYVLQEFANYGQIVRYIPPGQSEQGNWLHVKYQTRMQAQKALAKNGKVLGGQFMVGVMPCVDRKVMTAGAGEENADPTMTTTTTSRPSSVRPSLSRLDRTQSLRAGVRPLTPLNRTATNNVQDDTSIDPNSSKLPKKNTNLISKAMDFMFGW